MPSVPGIVWLGFTLSDFFDSWFLETSIVSVQGKFCFAYKN